MSGFIRSRLDYRRYLVVLMPVKLKTLSAMEVNIFHPFMVRTLQAFYKHDSPQMIQKADNTGNRATPVTARFKKRPKAQVMRKICMYGHLYLQITHRSGLLKRRYLLCCDVLYVTT